MSDYLDRPVYDDIEEEARADRNRAILPDDTPSRAELEADEHRVGLTGLTLINCPACKCQHTPNDPRCELYREEQMVKEQRAKEWYA